MISLLLASALAMGELDVAREALRDGLWDVARTHAAKVDSPEAKDLILESYACEGQWEKVLENAAPFSYYQALALAELGRTQEALTVLAQIDATTPHEPLISRLKARLALAEGRSEDALKLLKETMLNEMTPESHMEAADILLATGDRAGAEKEWREVISNTNASDRVYVLAAVNLSEIPLLREACKRAPTAELSRLASVRLGRHLLQSDEMFAEGESLIRKLVKDAPDTEGAQQAFVALADALLARKHYQEAATVYRQALEVWPQLAQQYQVQEGRGWVFRKLGKGDAAIEAFVRAEAVATNDYDRATALLLMGDTYAELGRGEDALSHYHQVLQKYPQTPAGEKLKVLVQLRELEDKGRELYRNYDFVGAQKIFAEVAEKDAARKPRMDYLEVLCLFGQGFDQEASARAQQLAKESSDANIRAEATLWLAKFAYNQHHWKEAQKLFASYADLLPKSEDAPSALLWSARAAFAANDFHLAIQMASLLIERYPNAANVAQGYLVQGEALIELARFDEAVLILERVKETRAQILRADAFFAMGADNPVRYQEALRAYRAVHAQGALTPSEKVILAFKTALTLEKMKRIDEAIDVYYTSVVLAYREGRMKGLVFDDEACAAFARAAFHLADEFESRGKDFQAMHILELVVASDVPASLEAEKRVDRIQTKGKFL